MIPIDEAFSAYAAALPPLPVATVPTAGALQRVLAESLLSATDLPRFDQSAMDGYAFASESVATAAATAPVCLPVVEYLAAGAPLPGQLLAAHGAARILTGAPLPPGADTVMSQEHVQRDGDTLVFNAPYAAGRNIRYRGEELRHGEPVATAGMRVGPGLLASLINAGHAEVRVHCQPALRLLVTGDEIQPPGAAPIPGRIPDSNGPFVQAVLARWGLPVPRVEYVCDRMDRVREALAQALDEADIVISTGGASVGDRDFLPAAAESLGLERKFWKVAQKPGKPLLFAVGTRSGRRRVLLALPGNPGAVLVGITLHLRRILDHLEGAAAPQPHWASGILADAVERDSQRTRLVRMQLVWADGRVLLSPLPNQDSHMLSNLAAAGVLVRIEAGSGSLERGDVVDWTALP